MRRVVWLRHDTVLAMQEMLIAEFDGAPGIRDGGRLASALARPENLVTYGTSSVFELAAALALGIMKNHPFVDGHKPVGFTAAAVFLELNGYRLTATEVEATVRTLALAASAMTEAEYASWLKANSE